MELLPIRGEGRVGSKKQNPPELDHVKRGLIIRKDGKDGIRLQEVQPS